MNRFYILTILCLSMFWSCQNQDSSVVLSTDKPIRADRSLSLIQEELADDADKVAVKVKMEEHSVQLVLKEEDLTKTTLSPASVKELEVWWDSLPKPLQSQIKANEVEIELITNVQSADQKVMAPALTDSQIENTGAELERIIGANTEMTFTVNTTILSDENYVLPKSQHSTNINLVKKVPLELKAFDFDILMKSEEILQENIQSLQYWWTTLPEGLREKIQSKEVMVNLTCIAVDKAVDGETSNSMLARNSEDHSLIMTDLLQQMMGYYSISNQRYGFGQINTSSSVETIEVLNLKTDVDYVLRLQLQNNKGLMPTL